MGETSVGAGFSSSIMDKDLVSNLKLSRTFSSSMSSILSGHQQLEGVRTVNFSGANDGSFRPSPTKNASCEGKPSADWPRLMLGYITGAEELL